MSLLSFAKAPDSLVLPKAADWMIPFLTSESPALEAMTDFRCAPAISVPENTQIDDALNRMQARSVTTAGSRATNVR